MKNLKKITMLAVLIASVFVCSKNVSANTNCGEVKLNSNFNVSVEAEDTNVYSFTVKDEGTIVLNGEFAENDDCDILLLDSNGKELLSDSRRWVSNDITGKKNFTMPYQVNKGKYYITVENNSDEYKLTSKINLKYTKTALVSSSKKLSGTMLRDEDRIYKVKIDGSGYFNLSGNFSDVFAQDFELYNKYGECIDDDNRYDDWSKNNITGMNKLNYNTVSVKKGIYYIKILNKSGNTLDYSFKLTINVPSIKVNLNKSKITLIKGKTYKLNATMKPAKTTDKLKWKSSNKKIATVDSKGLVKAKKKGTTYITVTTTSGLTKKCKVVVK